MAWLAVNKNGQEIICPNEPERWGNITKETTSFGSLNKETGKRYVTNPATGWEIENMKKEDFSYWRSCNIFDVDFAYHCIELPDGSIEKLIGKKLTWDDNPVEL